MDHRSLISFWKWSDIVVLVTTVATGIAVVGYARLLRPRLTLLLILGAYEAALNAALFLVALQPVPNRAYWYFYWYGGIVENLVFCLLAIEITCILLPRKQLAMAWCAAFGLLLVLAIGNTLPARTDVAMMRITLAGDFVCALVLIALLYSTRVTLPRSYRFVIGGVLLPAAIHAAATVSWLRAGLEPFIQAALPLASLLGLGLFMAGALIARKRESGVITDAGDGIGADAQHGVIL